MPRHLYRVPLELGLRLDINQLLRKGFIEPSKVTQLADYFWYDADGEVRATAQISADMTHRIGMMRVVGDWIDQTIQLVARPRHFGGQQWYFACPLQKEIVSILWSPPSKRWFAGRKSWRKVAYLSQFHAPGARAHYSLWKLCDRIGGPGASFEGDVPPKPKWMRWRTYERLSQRCEEYCAAATTLPIAYQTGDVV